MAVVGAGMAGLCMAKKIKDAGVEVWQGISDDYVNRSCHFGLLLLQLL